MTFTELLIDELYCYGPATALQLQERLLLRDDLSWWQRLRLTRPPRAALRTLERRRQVLCRQEPALSVNVYTVLVTAADRRLEDEAEALRKQQALVGRVVRALHDGCSCGRKRLEVAELWRLTDIVIDYDDYHAVPFGKETEWGKRYEYICPRGFVLLKEIG